MFTMRGWRGENQTCAGGLQGLGDEPGEAHVVADACDQGDPAFEIDGNHDGLSWR